MDLRSPTQTHPVVSGQRAIALRQDFLGGSPCSHRVRGLQGGWIFCQGLPYLTMMRGSGLRGYGGRSKLEFSWQSFGARNRPWLR